ncbi:MAG: hypothetical protein U0941_16275 [Planctomycetaceae bacterium]
MFSDGMGFSALLLSAMTLVPALWTSQVHGDEVVFADDFDSGLSSKWKMAGVRADDYRIRDGGLELRVQPGTLTDKSPMVRVTIPYEEADVLIASVDITPLDPFSEQSEAAGIYLTADGRPEFGTRKQLIDGHLVFSPAQPEFVGQAGEEGDSEKYVLRFWPATRESGPLRVILRNNVAYAQTGPSSQGKYRNLFHSALVKAPERGFALVATGGPVGKPHWVRFDNFRIIRSR